MSIRRKLLPFEKQANTTYVPNNWIRDKRISRRARLLAIELLSHKDGWEETLESLVHKGTEGISALRTARNELVAAGYLTVKHERGSDGRFESHYDLSDPFEVDNSTPENHRVRKPHAVAQPVDNSLDFPSESASPHAVLPAGEIARLREPTYKEINQSSKSASVTGAVDNSGDDDHSPHRPTPADVRRHKPGIDWTVVLERVPMFRDFAPDDLHAIGAEILNRASTTVVDETAFVGRSLENDPFEWQQAAFAVEAARAARGGNAF